MKKTLQTLKVLISVLVLSIGVQYAFAAWNGPTATPPGNNAPAPINVSNATQEKDGGLIVWSGGLFTGNGVWANQYCDENGENCVADLASLNLGQVDFINFKNNERGTHSSRCNDTDGDDGMGNGVMWFDRSDQGYPVFFVCAQGTTWRFVPEEAALGTVTADDIATGKVTQHRSAANTGTVTLVNVTGQGYLVGGQILGAFVGEVRIIVDGRQLTLAPVIFEDEKVNTNDAHMVTLPAVSYNSSLRVEYDAIAIGGVGATELVSGSAVTVRK